MVPNSQRIRYPYFRSEVDLFLNVTTLQKFPTSNSSSPNMYMTHTTFISFLLLPFVTHSQQTRPLPRSVLQCGARARLRQGCQRRTYIRQLLQRCKYSHGLCCRQMVAVPCNCKVECDEDVSCCVGLNDYGGLHDLGLSRHYLYGHNRLLTSRLSISGNKFSRI